MRTTHYELLGIGEQADAAAIRDAYRRAMRDSHPDLARGSHERASEINAAYAILSDPQERAAYDRGLDMVRRLAAEKPVRRTPIVPPRPRHSVLDEPEPIYMRPPSDLILILLFFFLNFVFVVSIFTRAI